MSLYNQKGQKSCRQKKSSVITWICTGRAMRDSETRQKRNRVDNGKESDDLSARTLILRRFQIGIGSQQKKGKARAFPCRF